MYKNKLNKKVICLLLVFCYSITTLSFVSAATLTLTMDVKIGSATGKPGDTVMVPIEFQNVPNEGINNCNFQVSYDPNTFDFVSAEPGAIIPLSFDLSSAPSNITPGNVYFLFNDSKQGSNPIRNSGIFAIIKFTIKAGASTGDCPVKIASIGSFATIINSEIASITATSSEGGITVTSQNVTPTPKPTNTPTGTPVKPTNTPIVTPTNIPSVSPINTPITSPLSVGIYMISKVYGKPGETVQFPIVFQGIPAQGINNCNFRISYDKNAIEITQMERGAIIPSNGVEYDIQDNQQGVVSFLFNDKSQNTNAIIQSGLFATLSFKIKDTANVGSYALSVSDKGSFAAMDNNKSLNIIPSYKEGNIVVTTDTTVTPIPTVTPSANVTQLPTSITSPVVTATPVVVIQPSATRPPLGIPADLAVAIETDKSTYGEDQTISFTINYKNKVETETTDVKVKAEIPRFTTLVNNSKGTVSGNLIEWSLGNLPGKTSGSITYTVKVGQLPEAQNEVSNTVIISSNDSFLNVNDDMSTIKVMLYSNRFGTVKHEKYIKGYPNMTFKAENQITRAEVAVIFANVLKLDISATDEQTFKDVPKSHWAFKYIGAVSNIGLFQGYSDNTFKPNDFISRAELATSIFRYLQLRDVEPLKVHFNDIQSHWAVKYIEEVYRYQLIKGYSDGSFKPNNKIKRVEVVTMFNRLLYRGPLGGIEPTFPDVKKSYWGFGQIEEAVRDHQFTRNNNDSEIFVSP